MTKRLLKVLLIDDHQLFRDGLRLLLERSSGLTVCGEAGSGLAAIALAVEMAPDVIVADIHMHGMDGIETARRIREVCPNAKVIFLSSDADSEVVRRAMEGGANGYLLKENASSELMRAIEAASLGGIHLCAEVAAVVDLDFRKNASTQVKSGKPRISERECEVLRLIAEGLRNKEIAERLQVSAKSVETYKARLLTKLGLTSTAELVRHAVRVGIVEP